MKKIIIGLFAIGLNLYACISPTQAASYQTLTDVDGSSYYSPIIAMVDYEIMDSITETEFRPTQSATRGETALYVARALGLDLTKVEPISFKDVPKSSKYYGAIAALSERTIIGGYGDHTFRPDNTLTRAQVAKILVNAFDLTVPKNHTIPFIDTNSLDNDTKRYIKSLVDHGITQGTTATTFSPNAPVNRGQLATFLYRILELQSEDIHVEFVE